MHSWTYQGFLPRTHFLKGANEYAGFNWMKVYNCYFVIRASAFLFSTSATRGLSAAAWACPDCYPPIATRPKGLNQNSTLIIFENNIRTLRIKCHLISKVSQLAQVDVTKAFYQEPIFWKELMSTQDLIERKFIIVTLKFGQVRFCSLLVLPAACRPRLGHVP
jgi:hypothetical protein